MSKNPKKVNHEGIRNLLKLAKKSEYYRDFIFEFSKKSRKPIITSGNNHLFDIKNLAVDTKKLIYYFFDGGGVNYLNIFPFTKKEWEKRNEYIADCYKLVGISNKDSAWISLPYGPWIDGHMSQDAVRLIGCNFLPATLSNNQIMMQRIWQEAQQMDVNLIISSPSILRFIEKSINGLELSSKINKAILSKDLVSKRYKKYFKNKYNIDVFNVYQVDNIFIGIECKYHNGFHYDPDRVLIEIVNERSHLEMVKYGNMLITSLISEAIPVIRYKINNKAKINFNLCRCGSNWPRLNIKETNIDKKYEISGGVNFSSSQISNALSVLKPKFKECLLEIIENKEGKCLMNFYIKFKNSDIEKIKNEKKFIEKIKNSLENMSLNFKDAIFEGYAEIVIYFRVSNSKKSKKINLIKIKDKRILNQK